MNIQDLLNKQNALPLAVEIQKDITKLKEEFQETDYKTMKNIQYEKMGKEIPYSWEEIDAKAEALRKQINEKEIQLNNLLSI